MKTLFILLLSVCLGFGATITGPVSDITGSTSNKRVEFWPQSTPFFSGTNLVIGGDPKVVQVRSNSFSVVLSEGRYLVKFPPSSNSITAWVPNTTNTYTLYDIQTNAFIVLSRADAAALGSSATNVTLRAGDSSVTIVTNGNGDWTLTAAGSAFAAADTVVSNGLSARLLATNTALAAAIVAATNGLTSGTSGALTNNDTRAITFSSDFSVNKNNEFALSVNDSTGFTLTNYAEGGLFNIATGGAITGNGSGLTNIPAAGVTGLPAALTYFTNNIGGGTITAASLSSGTNSFAGNGVGLTNIAGTNITGTMTLSSVTTSNFYTRITNAAALATDGDGLVISGTGLGINSGGSYEQFLTMPTFDGTNRVTHPNLLGLATNWNSYPYWITYTPYPDAPREWPHVAASRDLVNWVGMGPTGSGQIAGSNEVWLATGWTASFWTADPELYISTNGVMHCLYGMFRAPGGNIGAVLVSQSSTDGVTWSAPHVIRSNSTATVWFAGPQIVPASNGVLRLYYVDDNLTYASNTLWYVEGLDGSGTNWNWASTNLCTLTSVALNTQSPWHFDMEFVGDKYVMMCGNQSISYGEYYESFDGLTWTLFSYPLWSTNEYGPADGIYKPTFISRPGPTGKPVYDVIVGTQMTEGGSFAETNHWKLRLLSGFQPVTPTVYYNFATAAGARSYMKIGSPSSGYAGIGFTQSEITSLANTALAGDATTTIIGSPTSTGNVQLRQAGTTRWYVNAAGDWQGVSAGITNASRIHTTGTNVAGYFAGNGGGLTNVPLSAMEHNIIVRDEFLNGSGTAGGGEINWNITGTLSTRGNNRSEAVWGATTIESGSVSGTGGAYFGGATSAAYSAGNLPVASVANWESTFVFKLINTNDVAHAVGFYVPSGTWAASIQQISLRYDTSFGDTYWSLITRNATTISTNITTVQPRTDAFTKVEFRSLAVGEFAVRIDGSAWFTNSANAPTVALAPFVGIIPREAFGKTNVIDYFEFKAKTSR